ncbi:MAG: c-type cytochrome [Rhodomicrobium sp.]|jgi:mono/diheme cytochrome c family protein
MRYLWLRVALAAGPLLLWNEAAAQNPCGYAFSITGQKLFEDHCAACHGRDGTGGGPLAAAQKRPPANLTEIRKRNNGEFPAARVVEIIRLGGGIPGHEEDHIMPVWGKVFNGECGPAYSRRAIVELKRYLETMQK